MSLPLIVLMTARTAKHVSFLGQHCQTLTVQLVTIRLAVLFSVTARSLSDPLTAHTASGLANEARMLHHRFGMK
jgi:hypothetical protein